MTALVPLTTRLRMARVAVVVPPKFAGPEAADLAAHGAELALRAAQSALLHQGARGYLMSSAVQRRVRESHFVAIVTPGLDMSAAGVPEPKAVRAIA